MTLGPNLFVAIRSLLGRREKGGAKTSSHGGMAGAIFGISVSLIPVILVLVVSDGMIQGITRRYLETKTYHIQAALPEGFSGAEAKAGLLALKDIAGVKAVFFERSAMGMAVFGEKSHAVNLRSISEAFFDDKGTKEYLRVESGADRPSGRGVLVGSALASVLGLKVGSSLTIVTPSRLSGEAGNFPYSPKLSFFKVTGIVGAGYRDLDALWVFIDEGKGEELLVYPSSSACFGIKSMDPYSNGLGSLAAKVSERLVALYPGRIEPYFIRTWPEIEKSLFTSFSTTKSMLTLISALALLIAAVNLGSALSIFVLEHSLDIAIMRSFGASDRSLRRIFTGAGLATGIIGTLLGLALGLGISYNVNQLIAVLEWLVNGAASIAAAFSGRQAVPMRLLDPGYYLERIPVVVNYSQILVLGLSSVGLSSLVSLLPANKAVRVSVQDLIRKS